MIGLTAGSAAMHSAMTSMGFASESSFKGPIKLEGDAGGASVVILGAGVAGMTAALELRDAGYSVQILEYQKRAGGRVMSLRGGDVVEETNGNSFKVGFSDGQYLNNGPWRIPHTHTALMHYCARLGVELEPFVQNDLSTYLHDPNQFGGKPVRQREIRADYYGHVGELMAKAVNKSGLDENVSKEDAEILLESLRYLNGLDKDMRYTRGLDSATMRGYERDPGGGLTGEPIPSDPLSFTDVINSRMWEHLYENLFFDHQMPMFQPKGGMDHVAKGFEREVGDLITYDAKVTKIVQSDDGVTVDYTPSAGGDASQVKADYCVCTIPFSVLNQIDADLSSDITNAIESVWYHSGIKAGLEFKRRFWEQDEAIYGGTTYTKLPITQISYPSHGMAAPGPGVLLGAYLYGPYAFEMNAWTPEKRLEKVLEDGKKIHPQYADEFDNGFVYSWHQNLTVLGCYGEWRSRDGYEAACKVDRRLVCAGEHLSYLPGWQEGAILSSLDAVKRLHERAIKG